MSKEDEKEICFINKSVYSNLFLQVYNFGYIQDVRLSLKSKGLLTLMLTNKSDWRSYASEIKNHSADGITAIYSGFRELIHFKYLKKIQERDEKGHYQKVKIFIFDSPYDGTVIPVCETIKKNLPPNIANPVAENPHAVKPNSEFSNSDNMRLTKINLNENNSNNNNLDKTELTNYEQVVGETVLKNTIMELFSGVYPFDNSFENAVLQKLQKYEIEELNLKAYLSYVFERTKLANPMKSFSGLYRKLALSDSILRDFKMSNQFKKEEPANTATHNETNCECPICHTVFSVYDYYCPSCTLSVDAIKSNDMQEIKIKTKLFQMSEEERSQYNVAYQTLVSQKGRGFLTPEEQRQFYKDYGILN